MQPSNVHEWVRTISLALIPIVTAGMAYFAQRQNTQESIAQTYVNLSVSVLQQPESDKNKDLRAWAQLIFARYSPIPLSESAANQLRLVEVSVPVIITRDRIPEIDKRLMVAPKRPKPLPTEPLTNGQLNELLGEYWLTAETNADRLDSLERYLRESREIDLKLDKNRSSSSSSK